MHRRTLFIGSLAVYTLSLVATAFAKNAHHNNGRALLGEKIKRNGKHDLGKAGPHTVIADVSNGKVVNMAAGNLPVKKVKSRRQMAENFNGIALISDNSFRIAQADVWWYAYCFDDGVDEYCYWYPAEYVVVTDTWIEWIPS